MLAAEELLRADKSVLMLDIGETANNHARNLQQIASEIPPHNVSTEVIKQLNQQTAKAGFPRRKQWFGDPLLERWQKYWSYEFSNCSKIGPSTLLGGYSKIWGASCMPPDLLGSLTSLLPSDNDQTMIADVYNYLGIMTSSTLINKSGNTPIGCLSNVEMFVDNFKNKRIGEQYKNWFLTSSLIATNKQAKACTLCGNCLIGCPNEYIYNAEFNLTSLNKYPNFHYVDQRRCISFVESATEVSINCTDTLSNRTEETITYRANRVILAAGPLSTTEILSTSLDLKTNIKLITSQLFSFAALAKNPFNIVRKANRNNIGVSEAFLYENNTIRPNIFLQLYSSNRVLRYYGAQNRWISMIIENNTGTILDKLLIACQGYLDSNNSQILNFYNLGNGKPIELSSTSAQPKPDFSDIKALFNQTGYKLGPIKIHDAAEGYHFGGSFPIKTNGDKYSSDILGRPKDLSRIHIIDASVLPFIPAGPFTTLVLWNALRIVRKLTKLEN